jgi:hypothetical protein
MIPAIGDSYLEQVYEIVNRHARSPDQRTQGADGKFFMLGY